MLLKKSFSMNKLQKIAMLIAFIPISQQCMNSSSSLAGQQESPEINSADEIFLYHALLEAQEDLNKSLDIAIMHNRIDLVEKFINEGADVNIQDKVSGSSLHKASSSDIIHLLVDHGADVNAKNQTEMMHNVRVGSMGLAPLHYALIKGNTATAQALLDRGADPNSTDFSNSNALHYAAGRGILEIIPSLIQCGGNIHAQNNYGRTPLQSSLLNPNNQTFQILLDHGADVHVKDSYGSTMIFNAITSNNLFIIPLLVQRGVDINAKNNIGNTALHVAVDIRKAESIQLLIDQGADVNIQNADGETPLHWAALSGFLSLVQKLLNHPNIDLFVKNNKDKTAAQVARFSDSKKVIEDKSREQIMFAIMNSHRGQQVNDDQASHIASYL